MPLVGLHRTFTHQNENIIWGAREHMRSALNGRSGIENALEFMPWQAVDAARDPSLALMRLTWWRDTLSRAFEPGPAPAHPVARALREARPRSHVVSPAATEPHTLPQRSARLPAPALRSCPVERR